MTHRSLSLSLSLCMRAVVLINVPLYLTFVKSFNSYCILLIFTCYPTLFLFLYVTDHFVHLNKNLSTN